MAMMLKDRRRSAMKRLGAPICPKCNKRYDGALYDIVDVTQGELKRMWKGCLACLQQQVEKNDAAIARMDAQRKDAERRWGDATGDGLWREGKEEYRQAYGEYAEDIEVAMGSWQIGNGIVGPRR